LSGLIPYVEKINGSHQHKFGSNRSNTDHTLYICQILEKKWEYYGAVYEIFINFKKVFDLIMRGVCVIF
jgi:hypothetical protein